MRARRTRAALVAAAVTVSTLVLVGSTQATGTTSTEPSPSGSSDSPSDSSAGGSSSAAAGTTSTPDLVEPQTSSDGVQVSTYGTVTVHPYQEAERPTAVLALHGVQRVEGATVVYFSAGFTGERELDPAGLHDHNTLDGYLGAPFGSVRITDVTGGNVYRTVENPDDRRYAFASRFPAFPEQEPGVMGTLYAVLPELPATTEQVDVELVNGLTIPDVPVGEGYLEPTGDPETVIPLGTGWPEVDESVVARIDGAAWTFPLTSIVEALDRSQTVTEQGATVTIDLAADVLFAFDRADLTGAATTKLAEITQQLVADGATGQVSIIGHTDSKGSDSYNLDLSTRRAESVAAVLQPALAGQDLTFDVVGKGEAEPVASNSTAAGQQANRRVSVVYITGGG